MGKKHRSQSWAVAWREAAAYGCIIPEYVPECPDCNTSAKVANAPYSGTGIFNCKKCGGNIVVLFCQGEEASILLEELEDEGKVVDEQGVETVVAGLGVYSPMELVEDTDG